MRKYTIIHSDYATQPSAGYAQEFVRMVSSFDGWDSIEFLNTLSGWSAHLEDGGNEGEFFFYLQGDSDICFHLEFAFCNTEEEMVSLQDRNRGTNRRWFRWFLIDEDTGVEELEFLT